MVFIVGASSIGCHGQEVKGMLQEGFRRVTATSRFDRERIVSQVVDQDGTVIATAVYDVHARWGTVARPGGPLRVGLDPRVELSLSVANRFTLWAARYEDHVAGCHCGRCLPR